jgi:hypothetical protein
MEAKAFPMKLFFVRLMFVVVFLTVSGRAADAIYHNIGTVDCANPPQVDALVFLNDGSFCAQSVPAANYFIILSAPNLALSFTSQNTLWFTNNGLMQAAPGFVLDHITDDGIHHPAASIVNNSGGAGGPANIFGTQFVLLTATNVVNKGVLEVGPSGLMQLSGNTLSLARGGLGADPITGGGACVPDEQFSGFISPTNFFPISGVVLDDFWGIGTVTNLATDQIAQLRGATLNVQSPFHRVTNLFGFGNVRVGPMSSPETFVLTNQVVTATNTNWIVQAVFVGSTFGRVDSNITAQVKWVDTTIPENIPAGNGFRTAVVELRSVAENVVSGQPITYALYVVDQLATSTNLTSLTNLVDGTQRPAAYYVDIYPPCSFLENALSTNASFTNTMIYDPATFSNRVVTANYAGYEAFLATTGGGRIEISGDNVDLTQTRIRGEGLVTVQTPHLMGSSGLIVDSPNISYNIGSTNGLLSVSGNDLANPVVRRFGGTVQLWSAVWTNFVSVLATNVGPDPNDPTMTVTNVSTNAIEMDIHTLLVDAGGLVTTSPVLLNNFAATSTNIVLNDTIDANGTFQINGSNLTVNGRVSLGPSDWASTNVNLKSLTNNGTITVGDILELGKSTLPYSSVVNNPGASLSSFGMAIDADFVQHSGSISVGGSLSINSRTGKMEGGNTSVANNVSLSGRDLKMDGYTQSCAGLSFAVTNSLSDSGVGAGNVLRCNSGFNLVAKPRSGDLFGTTLQSQPGLFQQADHLWAAEDRGASPAGFTNNAVVGHLVLSTVSSGFLTFSGTGASNALYADLIDLRGSARTNLQSVLSINTNLVIYYADATNTTVEALDGLFADARRPSGRLRWVKEFAGPNSSVDVLLLSGQTVQMNRALRSSLTIDTDGDGVANGSDAYPLDAAAWNSGGQATNTVASISVAGSGATQSASISWTGTPGAIYRLEYTTSLSVPNWQPVATYTNVSVTNGLITISDKNIPAGESQRYYRLRYGQ